MGQNIAQAEGGEQGDPLMLGLLAVAVHPTLVAAHDDLRPAEDVYAFLDDTFVSCEPDRVCAAFSTLRAAQAIRQH